MDPRREPSPLSITMEAMSRAAICSAVRRRCHIHSMPTPQLLPLTNKPQAVHALTAVLLRRGALSMDLQVFAHPKAAARGGEAPHDDDLPVCYLENG